MASIIFFVLFSLFDNSLILECNEVNDSLGLVPIYGHSCLLHRLFLGIRYLSRAKTLALSLFRPGVCLESCNYTTPAAAEWSGGYSVTQLVAQKTIAISGCSVSSCHRKSGTQMQTSLHSHTQRDRCCVVCLATGIPHCPSSIKYSCFRDCSLRWLMPCRHYSIILTFIWKVIFICTYASLITLH